MTRGEPERVIDRAAFRALGRLRERGRPCGFLPGASKVGGTEHGRAEVPGLGRRQERAPVARIEHQMIDDVAEEMRPIGAPGLSGRIAVVQPGSFARRPSPAHDAASVNATCAVRWWLDLAFERQVSCWWVPSLAPL
jgi:hypothetical protein